ncbi:four helix bundle protein, partial [Patescibacteria group bacterium]|nr:four helix bundle protein [Patescibacteria group bacterium]
MQTYKDLTVYTKSIKLVTKIYKITNKFPDNEKFGLVSQMRRCAVSIPSNIAEGQQRNTSKEFANFLYISRGSIAELETQINIVKELDKNQLINFSEID